MRRSLPTPDKLRFLAPAAAGRDDVESFIADHYYRFYGSDLRHFLPYLLNLTHAGQSVAALGMSPPSSPFFLEGYLDTAIEHLLPGKPSRHRLVEIGNLAASGPGGQRWVVATLTAVLGEMGYEWAVFTGCRAVRNSFQRLRIGIIQLADAPAERIGATRDEWGTYYDHDPQVCAVRVQDAADALSASAATQLALVTSIWACGRVAAITSNLGAPCYAPAV